MVLRAAQRTTRTTVLTDLFPPPPAPTHAITSHPYSVQRQTLGSWSENLHFHLIAGISARQARQSEFHRPRERAEQTCPWTAQSRCGTARDRAGWGRAGPGRCCSHPSSSWLGVPPGKSKNRRTTGDCISQQIPRRKALPQIWKKALGHPCASPGVGWGAVVWSQGPSASLLHISPLDPAPPKLHGNHLCVYTWREKPGSITGVGEQRKKTLPLPIFFSPRPSPHSKAF